MILNVDFTETNTAMNVSFGESYGEGGTGQDGFSPIATVTQIPTGAKISITDINGTTEATITNGKDGVDGIDGYTPKKGIDYFDGEKGEKGDKGDKGDRGEQGIQGLKGDKGDTGEKGETGADGKDGTNGTDGNDGYTPQKGIDYWTEADKAEIKNYVDEAILGGAW